MNTVSHCNVRKRANQGFALLEALVALLLFSIGMLGLLGLQARAISTAGGAEDRNRAALIADRCASQMRLQAPNVTMTGGAASLANTCRSPEWSAYVSDPTRGGLPDGTITIIAPQAYNVVAGGAPLVPLTFDITVTWSPPVQPSTGTAASAPKQDQLTTTTTLLVQND